MYDASKYPDGPPENRVMGFIIKLFMAIAAVVLVIALFVYGAIAVWGIGRFVAPFFAGAVGLYALYKYLDGITPDVEAPPKPNGKKPTDGV